MTIATEVDVRQLSLEDLLEIKRGWYQTAVSGGKVEAARLVALGLGHQVGDDFEHEHDEKGQRISFQADRYFNGVLVRVNGKRVLDNRQGEKLFVPGGWELVLDRLCGQAQKALEARDEESRQEAQRQALIEELLLEE